MMNETDHERRRRVETTLLTDEELIKQLDRLATREAARARAAAALLVREAARRIADMRSVIES